MKIVRVLGVAVISALLGGLLTLLVSPWLTELYHVSNFEGGRGMLVFFALIPLGIIAGFVIGLVISLTTAPSFPRMLARSSAVLVGLTALVSGILFLAADHPPRLHGKTLAVEVEIKVPKTIKVSLPLQNDQVYATLYCDDKQMETCSLDLASAARQPDGLSVHGKAPLPSRTANRELLVSIETDPNGTQFIPIKLPARPTEADEDWSPWSNATSYADLKPVPPANQMMVRCRIAPNQ